jgi:hypothetical protein
MGEAGGKEGQVLSMHIMYTKNFTNSYFQKRRSAESSLPPPPKAYLLFYK